MKIWRATDEPCGTLDLSERSFSAGQDSTIAGGFLRRQHQRIRRDGRAAVAGMGRVCGRLRCGNAAVFPDAGLQTSQNPRNTRHVVAISEIATNKINHLAFFLLNLGVLKRRRQRFSQPLPKGLEHCFEPPVQSDISQIASGSFRFHPSLSHVCTSIIWCHMTNHDRVISSKTKTDG
ncbi:hypothetical protein [Roseinatronobacter monicus]|uniref:hypothetical protein n=1 Tax=Roseinatronobacter monicus TaxID=393481 RepID=UPI003CCC8157